MSDSKLSHEVDAATSICQARRAKVIDIDNAKGSLKSHAKDRPVLSGSQEIELEIMSEYFYKKVLIEVV